MKRTSRGLLLLAVLILGVGCKQQLKPLALNNFAAANSRKIAKAADDLRLLLLQYSAGKNIPAAQVRTACDNLSRAVADARAETEKISPDFLPQANEFYAAYQNFLGAQATILDDELPKILKIAEGPGGPGQKWNQLTPILTRIEKAEAAELTKLRDVQKRLADGGNFLPPSGV